MMSISICMYAWIPLHSQATIAPLIHATTVVQPTSACMSAPEALLLCLAHGTARKGETHMPVSPATS